MDCVVLIFEISLDDTEALERMVAVLSVDHGQGDGDVPTQCRGSPVWRRFSVRRQAWLL